MITGHSEFISESVRQNQLRKILKQVQDDFHKHSILLSNLGLTLSITIGQIMSFKIERERANLLSKTGASLSLNSLMSFWKMNHEWRNSSLFNHLFSRKSSTASGGILLLWSFSKCSIVLPKNYYGVCPTPLSGVTVF